MKHFILIRNTEELIECKRPIGSRIVKMVENVLKRQMGKPASEALDSLHAELKKRYALVYAANAVSKDGVEDIEIEMGNNDSWLWRINVVLYVDATGRLKDFEIRWVELRVPTKSWAGQYLGRCLG